MLAIKCETKLKFTSNVGHSYVILRQMLVEMPFRMDSRQNLSKQLLATLFHNFIPQIRIMK